MVPSFFKCAHMYVYTWMWIEFLIFSSISTWGLFVVGGFSIKSIVNIIISIVQKHIRTLSHSLHQFNRKMGHYNLLGVEAIKGFVINSRNWNFLCWLLYWRLIHNLTREWFFKWTRLIMFHIISQLYRAGKQLLALSTQFQLEFTFQRKSQSPAILGL